MILPTKNLGEERALLRVGADILHLLNQPKTISRLWTDFKRTKGNEAKSFPYDWFILALDFLHILFAIEYDRGKVRRKTL